MQQYFLLEKEMLNLKNKYRSEAISFANPLSARAWLSLLNADKYLGLSLKKNIKETNRNKLGFTFSSNEIGYHGKYNPNADNVILGTSYAMGFGVDEGCNWYELSEDFLNNYFNLGMPVSPQNHLNALNQFYEGDYKKLIYIYHPNIWITALGFYLADELDMDIFKYKKWRSDYISLIRLVPRWGLKAVRNRVKRFDLTEVVQTVRYKVSSQYSYYNISNCESYTYKILEHFKELFNRFDSVKIYRVPIKEQILFLSTSNEKLRHININYDALWEIYVDTITSANPNVQIYDLTTQRYGFDMSDYLPNDTHWSPSGNQKFYEIIKHD